MPDKIFPKYTDFTVPQEFLERQFDLLLGAVIGMSVHMFGLETVRKGWSTLVEKTQKPGFWETMGAVAKEAREQLETNVSLKSFAERLKDEPND